MLVLGALVLREKLRGGVLEVERSAEGGREVRERTSLLHSGLETPVYLPTVDKQAFSSFSVKSRLLACLHRVSGTSWGLGHSAVWAL